MYEAVFRAGKIGTLRLDNRLIVPAMTTLLSNQDGTLTEAYLSYYERKVRGGWGMVITENIKISPHCGASAKLPGLWEDRQIRSHRQLTERVHTTGGKICAQIYHAGPQASRAINDTTPVAPSPLWLKGYSEIPHELTCLEIQGIIRDFASAARRAVEADYDALELHGAHGYLIGRFLSGRSNKRVDTYGGSLEGRIRFLIEVISAVREAVGPQFPLLLRLSISEYTEGGITPQEAAITAMMAEEAGIDAVHCSAGAVDCNERMIPPVYVPRAAYADNAAEIRRCLGIPVIAVGRINDLHVAEYVLQAGKADFVAMGRASLADPDLPRKALEGREAEINYCIGCVQGCIGENKKGRHCTCLVNPSAGYETELVIKPTARPMHIAVVGGGIAGAEAAIIAASRGHRVELFEAADRLGGQWIAACIPPGKAEFGSFLQWQAKMLEQTEVTVHLGHRVTAQELLERNPDKIVLATGGLDFLPPIPGIHRAISAEAVLRGVSLCGQQVVVIGGGLVGAETAESLALEGRQVSLVEMLPEILRDGEPSVNHYLRASLKQHQVSIYLSSNVTEVGTHEVVLTQEGQIQRLPADTVLLAAGLHPDRSLWHELKDGPIPVFLAGNASETKNGFFNIREGFQVGLEL